MLGGTAIEFDEATQARRAPRSNVVQHAPCPVAFGDARDVHTGIGAKGENILDGEDAKIGDGRESCRHELPRDFVAINGEISSDAVALCFIERRVPADCRVVVVGAAIDDRVLRVHVKRMMIVRIVKREAELKDAHARKTGILSEFFDVWCDDAEVFGDDLEIGISFGNGFEEIKAWAFDPMTVDRRLFGGCDAPEGGKATEMVDSDDVNERGEGAEAFEPPVVT